VFGRGPLPAVLRRVLEGAAALSRCPCHPRSPARTSSSGQIIRLAHQGEAGVRGGAAGDVYVRLVARPGSRQELIATINAASFPTVRFRELGLDRL
jgi:hypothetical protein